jgi:hypothetical protein
MDDEEAMIAYLKGTNTATEHEVTIRLCRTTP